LPELAAGFGLSLIILWRGFGGRRSKSGDVVRWRASSGSEAVVFHLPPDGYEFGSSLPTSRDKAAERWTRIRETLAPRATLGISLIQNGADHHARQSGLREAVALLSERAAESSDRLVVSSMRGFAESIGSRAASQSLRAIAGELRDSYGYTWTLQGTFATRAAQKRANAIAERTLRGAEAWCAAAKLAGAASRIDHLRAAWKTLLEAHPHDTLCGTSVDPVAAAMDLRLSSARRQGVALAMRAIETLAGHDAALSRESNRERRDVVLTINGVSYERGGVVLIDEIEKLADEPVGPGSGGGPRISDIQRDSHDRAESGAQLLASRVGRSRIESARHYPDNDIVRRRLVARYLSPQPGLTVRALDAAQIAEPAAAVVAGRNELTVGTLSVKVEKKGAISLRAGDARLEDFLLLEDRADRGDLYTPSIGRIVSRPKVTEQELLHRGPLIGELAQEWTLVPENQKKSPRTTVGISLRLVADSPLLELRVRGVNRGRNHRLRIGIATGVAGATVMADAAFGPVERRPLAVSDADRLMETPPATAPLHRYVSLFSKTAGVTVHSDGLAEYEADADGIVWVTLLRAVGQLSRNDIPERPGHAGWPEPTPRAQSLGPFAARIAIQLHGTLSAATLHLIDRESDRFLHPLRGFTLRASTTETRLAGGIELSGAALSSSAIKESESGRAIVLRCVNLSEREQAGTWTLPSPVESAHRARLDETPLEGIEAREVEGKTVIAFTAGPRAVVTILVTPGR
jgi:hypothetical protein